MEPKPKNNESGTQKPKVLNLPKTTQEPEQPEEINFVNRSHSQPKQTFKLDYNQLEIDLQKELESDRLYWIRNSAKIRAVQGAGTYEDFRQKVLAAHLKPLEKKDTQGLEPNSSLLNKVVWNKGTIPNSDEKSSNSTPNQNLDATVSNYNDLLPKNIHEFKNQWKELTQSNTNTPIQIKLDYLKKLLDTKTLENLFKEEVPLEILPKLLEIFAKTLSIPEVNETDMVGLSKCEEAEVVLEILYIISQSKRFDFTKIFLIPEDTKNLETIFTIGELKAQNPKLLALLPTIKRKYL